MIDTDTDLLITGILFSDTSFLHPFPFVSYPVNYAVTVYKYNTGSDEYVFNSNFH